MKTRLKSKTVSALLVCMLIIGLFPTTVFAADTATVKINGQELQDGVPVPCGDGTAVFDAKNSTLTLNNATISQEASAPVLRVDNGKLKILLIGENTITSTTQRPFYTSGVDLTIRGTEDDSLTVKTNSDGLQVDNGNLTVDGCNIDITAANFGGMMCYGILTIQNSANITINSYENTLIGYDELSITDSTVNATSNANYSTSAIRSNGNMYITNSTVNATSNGDSANAFYNVGNISINNSDVVAATASKRANPAICADGNIEIINHSSVTVNSAGSIGVWSTGGAIAIQNSLAYVTAPSDWDAIRGTVGGAAISGSWVETFGSKVSPTFTSSDSVIFLNNRGTANGSLLLPGDVTVGTDMRLSIPDSSSITVPAGVTFINHGQIELLGGLINNGGKIICDSHSGGTATCTQKAKCSICGAEYGNLLTHQLDKTEAKAATCTKAGNKEYWTCKTCGKYFSDSEGNHKITMKDTVISATGHDFENGKCTVCGAVDPDYKSSSDSAQTGDDSNMGVFAVLAILAAAGASGAVFLGRKKKTQ